MSTAEITAELERLAVCLCSGMADEISVASKLRAIAKILKDNQSITTTTTTNTKK
jgi:hypothetical protein